MELIHNTDTTIQIKNDTGSKIDITSYAIYDSQESTTPISVFILPINTFIGIENGGISDILKKHSEANMEFNNTQVFKMNYMPYNNIEGERSRTHKAVTGYVGAESKIIGGYKYSMTNININSQAVTTTPPYALTTSTPGLFAESGLGVMVKFNDSVDETVFGDRITELISSHTPSINAVGEVTTNAHGILFKVTTNAHGILFKLTTPVNPANWITFVKTLRASDFTTFGGGVQYIALYREGKMHIYCNIDTIGCSDGISGQESECKYPYYYCNSDNDVKIKSCV
jgi:hypothetical protein